MDKRTGKDQEVDELIREFKAKTHIARTFEDAIKSSQRLTEDQKAGYKSFIEDFFQDGI
jgi:hypothetical protein